ncbi:hypothetical protein M3Y99_01080000 [Aphelenchoides fujianensis]|nr:hypothetical protein M3Y99_01080000 [Aphelenchoides fujianensis]
MPPEESSAMSTSMFAGSADTYGGSAYRSVAFKTWKVGEARRFAAERFRRHRTPDPTSCSEPPRRPASNDPKDVDEKPAPRTCPSSPSVSRSTFATPQFARRSIRRAESPAVRLAEAEDDVMTASCTSRMEAGDFYSSSEYVQFCTAAQYPYENVFINNSPPVCRQPTLNRSMDALNERIVHYAHGPSTARGFHPQDAAAWARMGYAVMPAPFTRASVGYSSAGGATLNRNWRVGAPPSRTPQPPHRREFVVDPGPLGTPLSVRSTFSTGQRYRAKSLDNANRINATSPAGAKLKRAGSRPAPDDPNGRSALQSAKNFLRRLYTTSTLRLRGGGRNARKMDAEQRFRQATAPFYEPRRPDAEERPFLPYNIRYEVEDDEDEGAVFDSHHVLNTPPGSSASTSTAPNVSPDEGMFSAGEESTASSTRSSAVSANGVLPHGRFVASNPPPQRPSSGLSSTTASSGPPASTYSASFPAEYTHLPHARQPPVSPERFRNWNDLFEHLKKEMTEMRARDAQLMHNLKTIEEELNVVKAAAV